MPGVFRPVGLAVLYLRFDEGLDSLPAEALASLGESGASKAPLVLNGQKTQPANETTARSFTLAVVPESMKIVRNPYRQADECSLTIRWDDMPVDPRLLRSLGVVAYLDAVPHDTWGTAMSEGVSVAAWESRMAKKTVKSLLSPRAVRFSGFADRVEETHDDGGEFLRIEARDSTQILLDTPVPTAVYKSVDWSRPIEELVLTILASCPAVSGCELHLVAVEPKTEYIQASDHQRGGRGGKKVIRPPAVKGESYWDFLTELTVNNGFVLYWDTYQSPALRTDGDAVVSPFQTGHFVLARPDTLFDPQPRPVWVFLAKRDGKKLTPTEVGRYTLAPFGGRARQWPPEGASSKTLQQPVMVYGHNLASLEISRGFHGTNAPGVELVCTDGKKTLRARWPQTSERANRVDPTGRGAQNEIKVFDVRGYTSQADLQKAAQQAFEEVGRGDIEVSFSTQDMASLGGGNSDPDLLELRSGVPIEILFAREDGTAVVGSKSRWDAMSEGQVADELVRRGVDAGAAKDLARQMRGAEALRRMQTVFYVRSVTLSLDASDGFSCDCEAVNYFEARVAKEVKAS